ncbi:hypothetical protein [Williamsia deligens]|uniref:Uncharacterized protein n=1 Tax=Williamsia deligens TaxID=321325 RepID=A0ABW3GAS1_9NOCA|nr:hypothetical protein [Williamsia deligens]
MTLPTPTPQACTGSFTRELGRPTKRLDSAAKPVTRRPTIALPDQSVTATTICRYRLTGATNGPDAEPIGSTRLSPEASTQLLHDSTATPTAPPCGRYATEIAGAQLFRPDGSGGANLTIELDGCRRLNIALFTTIRTAPTPLLQLLAGGP